jgi:hypothetical protein
VLALIGAAWAGVALTREPSKDETSGPIEAPPNASDAEAGKAYEREFDRRQRVAQLKALDVALAWQGAGLDGCAEGGQAKAHVHVGFDGVAKIKPARDVPAALAACLHAAYDRATVSAMLAGDVDVDYTFAITPVAGAVAPPAIDRDLGFGGLAFGTRAEDVDGLQEATTKEGTRFYERDTDFRTRWLGVPPATVTYGFGDDGLYLVLVRTADHTATFNLRQALRTRYGNPKTENLTATVYWRGEHMAITYSGTGDELTVAFLDVERGRASPLVGRLPGDPIDKSKELPPYLRQ